MDVISYCSFTGPIDKIQTFISRSKSVVSDVYFIYHYYSLITKIVNIFNKIIKILLSSSFSAQNAPDLFVFVLFGQKLPCFFDFYYFFPLLQNFVTFLLLQLFFFLQFQHSAHCKLFCQRPAARWASDIVNFLKVVSGNYVSVAAHADINDSGVATVQRFGLVQ